ncbi:MAG TPA: hypothetical protein VMW27_06960, partial [Thermoanaerobaculia bacterium]|nr:hypothetical protein [Thermoanaerobaculia bacterium]
VSRFRAGLTIDTLVAGEVHDPLYIQAKFKVGINLPWPLPDFKVNVRHEWGPEKKPPALPLPLQEVSIGHLKVTATWPLPAGDLLLPALDANGNGFLQSDVDQPVPHPLETAAPPPVVLPVVPLDARPYLGFGRSVHDDALIGVNPQPVQPDTKPDPGWEWIGDPAKARGAARVRYGLQEVALEKWEDERWTAVARKRAGEAAPPSASGTEVLYGSWAPMPQVPSGEPAPGTDPPVANTKLWLWSRSAFDLTSESDWDGWFLSRHPRYPCVDVPADRQVCCDFEVLDPLLPLRSPWVFPAEPRISLVWNAPRELAVEVLRRPVDGRRHALCFSGSPPSPALTSPQVEIRLTEPARAARITLAEDPSVRECVGFRGRPLSSEPNPRVEKGFSFLLRSAERFPEGGSSIAVLQVAGQGPVSGLEVGFEVDLLLPRPSSQIELRLTPNPIGGATVGGSSTITFEVYDDEGRIVEAPAFNGERGQLATVAFQGAAIARVVAFGRFFLHEVCLGPSAPVVATAIGSDGCFYGPFRTQGRTLEVTGRGLRRIFLHGTDKACVLEVCATFGLDPDEAERRREMARHLAAETERWSRVGEILSPNTTYRLRVVTSIETKDYPYDPEPPPPNAFNRPRKLTQFAYFRTEGPPRLARLTPPQIPDAETASGLDDLTRYVRQTVPPTVPAVGEKPLLPRPVYRANDVEVEFNEDYVDLLYRSGLRNLRLHLFDVNDRSVVDETGKPLALSSRWRSTEERRLTESEERWTETVNARGCARIDPVLIQRHRTLTVATAGVVLAPDTLHEARLAPVGPKGGAPGPVVYRFAFITSRFADFFHHLHSFQDETWVLEAAPPAGLKELVAAAGAPGSLPGEAEHRAFDAVAASLGAEVRRAPETVEALRLEQGGSAWALLLRSPEPLDWKRTDLQVLVVLRDLPQPRPPGAVKITEARLDAGSASVDLVLREAVDLTGVRLEVRTATGEWQTFFTFGPEARQLVGRRIRIYAPGATGVDEPGILRRSAPSSAPPLPAAGAELRLLGADGVPGHARFFLPGSAFAAAGGRLLRKADGTALCLVIPAAAAPGSAIPKGQYRLAWTWRRDNRAADPGSPVLRKAGDASPEHAVIDLP